METRVYKDMRGNWAARTAPIHLHGNIYLSFITVKTYNGNLVSYAHTERKEGEMMSYMPFSDYRYESARSNGRVTENVCRKQHMEMLENLSEIIAQAKKFYNFS